MSHIIIIGNGFDRNLGFPTGYTDFIESPCFQALLPNNDLAQHLQRTHNLNNWIDVENEFQRYSNNFSVNPRLIPSSLDKRKVKSDYLAIKKALVEYLKGIDYTQYNKDSEALKLLSTLPSVILDFNYTPTISNILEKRRERNNTKHIKVHGSLNNNNIVFGVSDDAEIFPEHNFLKKSTTAGFPAVNFDDYFRGATHISIFGHSLGNMDYDYFKDFFGKIVHTPSKGQYVSLYFKGDEDRDSINDRLIELTDNNLARFKKNLGNFREIECR